MRIAGRPEIAEVLNGLRSSPGGGGAPPPGLIAREGNSDRMEAFVPIYELLRSKGYSDAAAQQSAMNMLDGREPMARPTQRFAAVYGNPS